MAFPKSVVRINKGGIKFTDNVDKAQYTIYELARKALGESVKLVRKRTIDDIKQLRGMRRAKRPYSSTKWKVKSLEEGAVIGFSHDSWYGARSELGTHGSPARGILRKATFDNIDDIRLIQAKYLSAVDDENRAKGLIHEGEMENKQGDEQ